MRRKLLTLLFLLLAASMAVNAQGRRGLRINEVMVQNDSNYVDEYGRHGAWIEIFNSNYGALEINGVYLTTDSTNTTMYQVPKGDALTRIPKRQHVIFWADGEPTLGTFHTSLTLVPGQDNWIGLYDANGRTLIDSVTVPASVVPNSSYARKIDGVLGEDAWEVRDASTADLYVTPSSANKIADGSRKSKMFAQQDANGLGMAIMAMCIVFSALLLLCLCFYVISRIGEYANRRNKAKSKGLSRKEMPSKSEMGHDTGEEIAAIAMALYQHLNAHDNENHILTINKVKKAYSPWNSKIYNLRSLPK